MYVPYPSFLNVILNIIAEANRIIDSKLIIPPGTDLIVELPFTSNLYSYEYKSTASRNEYPYYF